MAERHQLGGYEYDPAPPDFIHALGGLVVAAFCWLLPEWAWRRWAAGLERAGLRREK